MIEDGVLTDPAVSAIAALHVAPEIPAGQLSLNRGFVTAQSDDVDLVILGESAHAAHPKQGADASAIAAQALSAIQQFVSRGTAPVHRKVVTFGMIHGGTRRNILADRVELTGTIRSFEYDTREAIVDFIGNRLRAIVSELGGRLDVTIEELPAAAQRRLGVEAWPCSAGPEAVRRQCPSLGAEIRVLWARGRDPDGHGQPGHAR